MQTIPRLKLRLEERKKSGTMALGEWDLTLHALLAIEDGQISQWTTGRIGSSVSHNLYLPHKLRMAAWNDSLFICENETRLSDFLKDVYRLENTKQLLHNLEALEEAKKTREYCENLLSLVEKATFCSKSENFVYDPLTGEISDKIESETPFVFATKQNQVSKAIEPDFSKIHPSPSSLKDRDVNEILLWCKELLSKSATLEADLKENWNKS